MSTGRLRFRRAARTLAFTLLVVQLAALLVHRVIAPMGAPDPRSFPRAGDRFSSASEGFSQEILGVDARGQVSSRITLAPGASGPPRHYHRSFVERFTVREGTLSIEVGARVLQVPAGQRIEIAAGVAHRPFNAGTTPVVVEGDSVMPIAFAACLVQLYKIMDEHPDARGRSMLLQMSVRDPSCDTHVEAMPAAVERALELVVAPWARLAGYRNHYPELALHR